MATVTSDLQPTTRDRILDAAFEAVQVFGLSRITVEDVAHRARLSRQTVYRYFPSKDHVVLFLVAREEEKFMDGVRAAFASHEDPEEALALAVAFVLRYTHEHPLLDRLLATDEQTLLPYLTTRGLPLIMHARETLVELMAPRLPGVELDELRAAGRLGRPDDGPNRGRPPHAEPDADVSTRQYVLPVDQTKWEIGAHHTTTFTFDYDEGRDRLLSLYEKGKEKQWNTNTRIDWSTDVD